MNGDRNGEASLSATGPGSPIPPRGAPDVEREELTAEDEQRLAVSAEISAQFELVETILQDDHGVDVRLMDADGSRLVADHGDGSTDRYELAWSSGDVDLRIYADSLDPEDPRVVATVADVAGGGYEGPVEISTLDDPVTLQYFANDVTVLADGSPHDRVQIGVEFEDEDHLDAMLDAELLERAAASNREPHAELSMDAAEVVIDEPIEFSAVGSYARGPAPIQRYEWVFDLDAIDVSIDAGGVGAAAEAAGVGTIVSDPLQIRATHRYEEAGEYTVGLVVQDADGNRSTATTDLTVDFQYDDLDQQVEAEIDVVPADGDASVELIDRTVPPIGDDIVHREWRVGEEQYAGVRATHTFESEGIYTARLTVTTREGRSDSATRTFMVGFDPDELGEHDLEVSASLAMVERLEFDGEELGDAATSAGESEFMRGLTNANFEEFDSFAMPNYGPQVVAPGSSVEFTARDSSLPDLYGDVTCRWRVYKVPFGLPRQLMNEITDDSDPRVLDPETDATAYGNPTHVTLDDPQLLPELERDGTPDLDGETGLREGYVHDFPVDPDEWTYERNEENWDYVDGDFDVEVERPVYVVEVEVVAEGVPDTDTEWGVGISLNPATPIFMPTRDTTEGSTEASDVARTYVYLDHSSEPYDLGLSGSEEATLQQAVGEDFRWVTGRPGIPGYLYDRSYEPNDERIARAESNGHVVVPTRAETVDYLYCTGWHGIPANYERTVLPDVVDVQWLSYERIGWGVPDPQFRAFVPYGVPE